MVMSQCLSGRFAKSGLGVRKSPAAWYLLQARAPKGYGDYRNNKYGLASRQYSCPL